MGKVKLTIFSARDLRNADWFNKSDSRAIATVFDHDGQPLTIAMKERCPGYFGVTQVIKDNLNPVWNEEFTLDVSGFDAPQLRIKVMDSDGDNLLGFDSHSDGLGSITMNIPHAGIEKTEVQLIGGNGKSFLTLSAVVE